MDISILGIKVNSEIFFLMIVVWLILITHCVYSCCGKREYFQNGFQGIDTSEVPNLNTAYSPVDVSMWDKNNVALNAQHASAGATSIINRPKQPIPLPEGEMVLFAKTPFLPECCPNTYSTSKGCACMTIDQQNYLMSRGGNNVPYSEY
jgi:hypothetical protein